MARKRRRSTAARAQFKPLERTLRQVFNHPALRPGQQAVIQSVLDGRDTLAIMPTGAGKSLCYQLPALHLPGMTVVVSPLISLMKDQVDKLEDMGVDASQINSAQTSREHSDAMSAIADGRPEFIMTTPERMADPAFLATLRGTAINLFVVDEAHCISQWGHDFRPAYLELAHAIRELGGPPVLALTATASREVAGDIARGLQLRDVNVISTGIYQSNLRYEVVPGANEAEKQRALLELVTEAGGTGIVYTSTVKHAEAVATLLQSAGVNAGRYHGRLGARERHEVQERFMRGDLTVIVATNAFGMGIDKPDIRLVVHYNMPGSLDAYYQESGRAGRDGEPATCTLLYQREDRHTHVFFMSGRYPRFNDILAVYASLSRLRAHERPVSLQEVQDDAAGVARSKVRVVLALFRDWGVVKRRRQQQYEVTRAGLVETDLEDMAKKYEARQARDREKLDRMIEYSQTAMCRWKKLVDYFGEVVEWERCDGCDSCSKEQEVKADPSDTMRVPA